MVGVGRSFYRMDRMMSMNGMDRIDRMDGTGFCLVHAIRLVR